MADNVGLGTFGSSSSTNTPSLGVDTGFANPTTAFASQLQSQINQTASVVSKPWDSASASPVNSAFFSYINPIDATRWNQLFPYRLLVIDVNNGNTIVNGGSSLGNPVVSYQQGTTTLSFTPTQSQWIFSLPITPQQLNIVDQYAIQTTATLRGILEEHNGVKFKLISASGTMGVWPYRSAPQAPGSPNVLQSVFGGTINAVNSLVSQAQATVRTFTTGSPASKPITPLPGSGVNGAGPATSTGYYQAMMFQQFLEQYAEAKKDPANSGWRLVFDIPKQNQSYVVTPMQFTWQQSVQKPMEIMYQLQFKAWRRINLQESPQQTSPAQAYTVTPGILQRILNGITEARLTCSSAIGVIGAVTADVNNIFNVLSQTALFVKDLLGVAVAASDLPSSITKDFNSAIQQYTFTNSASMLSTVSTAAGAAAVAAVVVSTTQRNGISQTAASNGQLGPNVSTAQQTNAAAAIFNNPNANVDFLDQVPVNQLSLNNAQQKKLNSILSNTSLSVAQLQNNANVILNLTTLLADYFGAGDAIFNNLFGLLPPPVTNQPMSINQFLILDTLYEFIQGIGYLTATTQVTDQEIVDSLNYVAGLANTSGIPFTVPNSKIYVPVPYGLDLEGIAARYLGDPQRWIEIATLNQLEEPYIDQSGFQLPLLSNAIGRQVIVSSNQNLYLQQTVTLNGANQIPISRQIDNITTLPNNGGFILTLNGEPNLGNFTLSNQAYVQAYLPNTVNSQQKIFIPSTLPSPEYPGQLNILPPAEAQSDPLTGLSGVDFLLTESGDIVLDQFANFQISFGLTNLIQALRILFTTTLNSFLIHPEYGLGVSPGTSVSDINIQQFYQQINSQVLQDPRFASITGLQITANPPILTISLGVSLPGNNGTLPISFQLAA
jgi:hypothetical protein